MGEFISNLLVTHLRVCMQYHISWYFRYLWRFPLFSILKEQTSQQPCCPANLCLKPDLRCLRGVKPGKRRGRWSARNSSPSFAITSWTFVSGMPSSTVWPSRRRPFEPWWMPQPFAVTSTLKTSCWSLSRFGIYRTSYGHALRIGTLRTGLLWYNNILDFTIVPLLSWLYWLNEK